MIRSLLARCWDDLEHDLANHNKIPDREQFVRSETAQLALYRDEWFELPDNGLFGKPPRWFCERERRRLPLAVTGPEMMPVCDCPLCQMMIDSPAPMLTGLDGSDFDDEFVFDFSSRTQEDWDQQQVDRNVKIEPIKAEIEVRQELGLPNFPPFEPPTFFDEGDCDWNADLNSEQGESEVAKRTSSLELCLFEVDSELANVIVGLRGTRNEFREMRLQDIECLNQHFANLRAACGRSQEPISSSLMTPVIDRFRGELCRVARDYPELAASCDEVFFKLDEFLMLNEND